MVTELREYQMEPLNFLTSTGTQENILRSIYSLIQTNDAFVCRNESDENEYAPIVFMSYRGNGAII